MTRVLVVSAHPDDEVLGPGGAIARHAAAGDEVYLCILSEGASAQYRDPQMIEVRRNAAVKAAKVLGIRESFYHDFPDSRLEATPHIELNAVLEMLVRDLQPETVYTHFAHDTDLDHRRVYESTIVATRPKSGSPVRRVLMYEVLGQTHWAGPMPDAVFVPNVFIDVSASLGSKLEALRCYASEVGEYPHPRSPEAVEALARLRGVQCGVSAAEAFMLVREVVRS